MSTRADLKNAERRRAEAPILARRQSTWTGPVTIGLTVALGVVVLVGGLYLVLQRVPAAPARTQQIGSVRATLESEPRAPWSGVPALLTVSIVDHRGAPVSDAQVTLSYDMETDSIGRRMEGMGPPGRIAAHLGAPGRYVAPVNIIMAGLWRVRAAIARGGRPEGQGEFPATVR